MKLKKMDVVNDVFVYDEEEEEEEEKPKKKKK
jgi:hypothetical protein